jgi:putative DNA primase/helicase
LPGETDLECFFILYGSTTRNGKSTLTETIAYILGDYARTIQAQTLAKRPPDGSAATPDIARLKGARLVNTP